MTGRCFLLYPRFVPRSPFPYFERRELEIIQLRTSGVNTQKISEQLGISRRTVQIYLAHVQARLGLEDVVQLTRWAIEYGFDEPLPPEGSAERPYPGMPKKYRKRIKLRRVIRTTQNTGPGRWRKKSRKSDRMLADAISSKRSGL